MGEVFLNGRPARDDLPETVRKWCGQPAREYERELLAGVLTERPVPADVPRPVMSVDPGWNL